MHAPSQQIENNSKREAVLRNGKNDSSHGIDLICTPGNLVVLITIITWQPSTTVQLQLENTDKFCVQVSRKTASNNVAMSSGPQPDSDNMQVAAFWGSGREKLQCKVTLQAL